MKVDIQIKEKGVIVFIWFKHALAYELYPEDIFVFGTLSLNLLIVVFLQNATILIR